MKEKIIPKTDYRKLFVLVFDIFNIIGLIGIWAYGWMKTYAETIARPFGYKGNWLVFALYGAILIFITHAYGGYKVGHHKGWDLFFSGILSLWIANILGYIQTMLLAAKIIPFLPILGTTLTGMVYIVVWVFIAQSLYKKIYPPYDMLVVYDGKKYARDLIRKVATRGDKYRIYEAVDICEGVDYVTSRMHMYSSVIFSDLTSKTRNVLLKYAYKHNISVYVTPKLSDILIRTAESIELFDTPLLLSQNKDLSVEQRTAKRIMDILVSLVGIVITMPIMLLIAIAVKIDDKGTVFYSQERLTLHGNIFSMLKFRSMKKNMDKIETPRLASEGDPRITRVGKVIRKFRVDELPQLFNILKGDMSVIGPRPEHPVIAAEYEKSIPEFVFRLNVKAGLTGYAQVVGKYNTTPYDKLKLDLMYITGYSFVWDLKILLMTVKILFNFESTEGIAQNQAIATIYRDNEGEDSEEGVCVIEPFSLNDKDE